ncbi:MAG: 1,4-dihydroxy-2-naphthoate polyprenyltransferase [Actinomycetales bacterium]|nr:1,4-dihydroxy-2-naphthoate polyprenyltransferase [Actinomycetales bacterium]
MATLRQWVDGARPRTLPAAISPVLVGSGFAALAGSFIPVRAMLALVVALGLQVGVNYANDYSDGIKGTDRVRVGPVRLVGQGLAKPAAVRTAAWAAMAIAMVSGLILVAATTAWWLLAVGAACVVAAWLYTGGPRPYGYLGLGEVFVFVFFGIVPVLGTMYVQAQQVTAGAVCAAIAVGLLTCNVLVANNLRDIPTDAPAGKRTLAVRLGDRRTRQLYAGFVLAAAVATLAMAALSDWWLLLGLLGLLPAVRPIGMLRSGVTGPGLIPVLKQSGMVVLAYGAWLTVILAVLAATG